MPQYKVVVDRKKSKDCNVFHLEWTADYPNKNAAVDDVKTWLTIPGKYVAFIHGRHNRWRHEIEVTRVEKPVA